MEFKKILPPGTVFNTSERKKETEIKRLFYNETKVAIDQSIDNSQLWIKVTGLTDTEKIVDLLESGQVDILIIEDIFNLTQRAKIEEIDNGFFAIVKTTSLTNVNEYFHEYVSLLLKDNVVYTFTDHDSKTLDIIEKRIENNEGKLRKKNASYLFYAILDSIIDRNILFEQDINKQLSNWEEKIIYEKTKNIEFLHELRKEVLLMKTNIFAINSSIDLIHDFYQNQYILEFKKYYKDLMDHIYRLNDRLVIDWENLKTLYEMHINNVNERTNSIMKVLTIFSAIFIPLSFMAGVFGMNFVHMPLLQDTNGIWIFIAICAFIVITMLFYFNHKKWL